MICHLKEHELNLIKYCLYGLVKDGFVAFYSRFLENKMVKIFVVEVFSLILFLWAIFFIHSNPILFLLTVTAFDLVLALAKYLL
jgi:hypothetical protein